MCPEALSTLQECREFFGRKEVMPVEAAASELIKKAATTKCTGMLLVFLSTTHDIVQKRKGCKAVLSEVAEGQLPVRQCVLQHAERARTMGPGLAK